MNFLDILTGSKKTSAREIAGAVIELEVKRDNLISQAEPSKKELSALLKQDLAGIDVNKQIKDIRAKFADFEQKINAANESITELRQKLIERLQTDHTERLSQIEKKIEGLKGEKKRWRRDWISAYARFKAICDFLNPGATVVSIYALNPEDRDFFNDQVEKFKQDLNIEGCSIPGTINSLLSERQQLQLQKIDEGDADSLIEKTRNQSAA